METPHVTADRSGDRDTTNPLKGFGCGGSGRFGSVLGGLTSCDSEDKGDPPEPRGTRRVCTQPIFGRLAQLVERLLRMQEASGSSPEPSTQDKHRPPRLEAPPGGWGLKFLTDRAQSTARTPGYQPIGKPTNSFVGS